jgi:hypothetical protein
VTSITVEFDVNRCSPNKRLFWARRAKQNKQAEACAHVGWWRAGRTYFGVPIDVNIVIQRGRGIDEDNAIACCKPVIDALFKGRVSR